MGQPRSAENGRQIQAVPSVVMERRRVVLSQRVRESTGYAELRDRFDGCEDELQSILRAIISLQGQEAPDA